MIPETGHWPSQQALDAIYRQYGDVASITRADRTVLKFGHNPEIGTTRATVQTLPSGVLHETFVSTNAITHISSTDAGDTEPISIQGFTVADGVFTAASDEVTLTGQTKVALNTPMARVQRMYAAGTTDLAGTVWAYEDDTTTGGAPDDDTLTHCAIEAGRNQSQKASMTTAGDEYLILSNVYADCLEKAATYASVDLEIRLQGKVFRTQITINASSTGGAQPSPILPIPDSPAKLGYKADSRSIRGEQGHQRRVRRADSNRRLGARAQVVEC